MNEFLEGHGVHVQPAVDAIDGFALHTHQLQVLAIQAHSLHPTLQATPRPTIRNDIRASNVYLAIGVGVDRAITSGINGLGVSLQARCVHVGPNPQSTRLGG